jgi:CheY-like chemotaxis protein
MSPPADTLPTAAPAAPSSRTETAPVKAPVAAPGRSILVVDDSALIREATKIALGTIGGWCTVTASCGEEGIERASSERFDAILLDVEMPDMDGIAVAERLQRTPSTSALPIILLTAHEHIGDSPRVRDVSIAGTIAKPFDVRDLSRQVAILLRWPV